MKTSMTTAILAAMIAAGPFATRAEDAGTSKGTAVMCPKCETVWVKSQRPTGKTDVHVYTKKMACDDCKSAVANFFATGKFEHTCKTCGDMIACEEAQAGAGEAEKPAGTTFVPGTDAAHSHHTSHPEQK